MSKKNKYNRICYISAGTAVYSNSDEPQLKIYRYSACAENAEVYDKNTGRKIKEIVKDGYMTYVFQVGEYVMIQYICDDGYYYAHLTDSRLNTAAVPPYFTDYPSGNIRSSKIIGIGELLQKAKTAH